MRIADTGAGMNGRIVMSLICQAEKIRRKKRTEGDLGRQRKKADEIQVKLIRSEWTITLRKNGEKKRKVRQTRVESKKEHHNK